MDPTSEDVDEKLLRSLHPGVAEKLCDTFGGIMRHPVWLEKSRHTFDKKKLDKWLDLHPTRCPATGKDFGGDTRLEYTDDDLAIKFLIENLGTVAFCPYYDTTPTTTVEEISTVESDLKKPCKGKDQPTDDDLLDNSMSSLLSDLEDDDPQWKGKHPYQHRYDTIA